MPRQPERQGSDLTARAIALAAELGRITGKVEGTAKGWMNDPSLTAQLTRLRDGATQLLQSLPSRGGKRGRAASRKATASGVRGDRAHAPGKRRRKPAPTVKGARKSDERIPKMRTAKVVRRRRKSTPDER